MMDVSHAKWHVRVIDDLTEEFRSKRVFVFPSSQPRDCVLAVVV